jgi:outer membrane biosynthesis protein TonB
MDTTPASVLDPAPQPLWLPFLAAIGLHGFGVVAVVLFEVVEWNRSPVLDLDQTIEVSLFEVKRAPGLPRVATHAPVPAGAPEPQPAPAPPPPPVQSDLAVRRPEPEPTRQGAVTPQPSREDRLRELRRQALLDAAREGATDQEATDPNGTSNVTRGSGASFGDPRLAAWKERVVERFDQPFEPRPDIVAANPGISAVYRVVFDQDSGRVSSFTVVRTSGNASYDAAVERAIRAVPVIELPPAEFRDVVGRALDITFEP